MELEQTAESRMQQTDGRTAEAKNPAPDKEKNQMAWVQHMNSLKAQAEELDSDGTDLQLSFLDAAIPTEAEQIEHRPSGERKIALRFCFVAG